MLTHLLSIIILTTLFDCIFHFLHRTGIGQVYALITGHSKKKVYRDLEKCGFLHGVQHVSNNIFEVFLDIVNFLSFSLYFMGIFGKFFLKLLKMEIN